MKHNFDKKTFAKLLKRAMGSRSINQYGLHSNVSATYISKLLRCLVDKPPGVDIIRKLADKAQYGITFEDLMAAAGHLPDSKPPEDKLRIDLAHVLNNDIVEYEGTPLTQEERESVKDFLKVAMGLIKNKKQK